MTMYPVEVRKALTEGDAEFVELKVLKHRYVSLYENDDRCHLLGDGLQYKPLLAVL